MFPPLSLYKFLLSKKLFGKDCHLLVIFLKKFPNKSVLYHCQVYIPDTVLCKNILYYNWSQCEVGI